MRIRIRPFLSLRKSMGDQTSFELQGEGLTLRSVLEDLSERFGLEIGDLTPNSEIPPEMGHIKILVNGRNYNLHKNGLDLELNESDEIAIFPPMAGG